MFDKIRQIMFPLTVLEAYCEFETSLLASSDPADKEKINLRNYRSHLGSFIQLHQNKPVASLVPADADAWIAKMVERGLAVATINGRVTAIQAFERFCRRRYPKLAKKTVAFSLHLKKREEAGRADETIPDDDEITRAVAVAYEMLDSGDMVARRDATIFLWVIETGSRRKETARLRLSRLHLDKPSQVRDEGGKIYNVYEAKVDGKWGQRPVDFTEEMARILREWLRIRPGNSDFVFVGLGNCGRHKGEPPTTCYICRSYGKPISPTVVTNTFIAIAERANVDPHKLGAHGARHWLTQKIVDAVDVEVAQLRLGHRQITTTLRYTHRKQTRRKQGAVATSFLTQNAERGVPHFLNSVTPPIDSVPPSEADDS